MNVEDRFKRDAAQWKAETSCTSNAMNICVHPAYQRIIGLGPAAVPLIIESLRRQPDHYFWALTAIVGDDKAAGAQTIPEAAQRWVQWYDESHADLDDCLQQFSDKYGAQHES